MPGCSTGVLATGSYLPKSTMGNEVLERSLGLSPGWIEDRTGILERRVADSSEATSDLATAAARRALDAAGVRPDAIGLIIVATSTPDMPLPATACQVQANLGASNAVAMDIDAVCTGFVYALDVAHKMMLCEPAFDYALVIGADTYSRILDYRDRRTAVLFGDGAGAVVLGRSETAASIEYSRLGSDGTKVDYVQIPAGGSRDPLSADTLASGDHFFKMDGRSVREFVEERLPQMIDGVMRACAMNVSEVDLFVPHQANGRILVDVAKEVGFLPDQVALTVDHYGNTGAASIPVTLDHAVHEGRVLPGDRVLLAGFGGGMTWGTTLLTWGGGRS
ncbi:beta-ketoacyl-ACP synthase III [Amycolatopsis sp. NPDC026612]|uniref:3-oxoacyl-ACP synthase III family protein n=1 Tax=Amycolatopsis sp. NPDC026612 TaxID=3155466 RepID=UPI0033FFF700